MTTMAGASIEHAGDKYRSHLIGEGEKHTHWRHGAPPSYHVVNKLFEQERTQEWPAGSLEETVQNAVKTLEMELAHKTHLQDHKTINHTKFKFIVNGTKAVSGEEMLEVGTFNALLKSSLPEEMQWLYRASEETLESSNEVFRTAFPRGFAWEVVRVDSPPPVITFQFRHWGYLEGPFKGLPPTGVLVEFSGKAVLKVDDHLKAEEAEIYFDPVELFAGLLKGLVLPHSGGQSEQQHGDIQYPDAAKDAFSSAASNLLACPFFKEQ